MRGHRPTKGLNEQGGARGWLARQEAVDAAKSRASEWKAIDAERQAFYAQREREALALADRRRAENAKLRVSCPCCGSGAVPVEQAELILSALDQAPVDEQRRMQAIREKDTRSCPVCDHGTVDSELADRVVDSLSKLPASRDVDYDRIRQLYGIAKGETYHGIEAINPKNGAKRPCRALAVAASTPQAEPAAETAEPVKKPARRHVVPPHLSDD